MDDLDIVLHGQNERTGYKLVIGKTVYEILSSSRPLTLDVAYKDEDKEDWRYETVMRSTWRKMLKYANDTAFDPTDM